MQSVVGTVAAGEPGPGVPERGIRAGGSRGNVVGASRNRCASERYGKICRKDRRAWRSRTNRGPRLVGVDADQFVVAVRTHVADGQSGIG